MTAIALWLLLGAPAPSPMPTLAPARPVALGTEEPAGTAPVAPPFLRSGVRVVAAPPESDHAPAPKEVAVP